MQRLEVSGAVRPIYGSLGVKRLIRSVGACGRTDEDTTKLMVACGNYANAPNKQTV